MAKNSDLKDGGKTIQAVDPFKTLLLDGKGGEEPDPTVMELSPTTRRIIEERKAKLAAAQPKPKLRWYEFLEMLTPYRDVLLILGFGFVVAGVALWTVPGALVLSGIGLMAAGILMSR